MLQTRSSGCRVSTLVLLAAFAGIGRCGAALFLSVFRAAYESTGQPKKLRPIVRLGKTHASNAFAKNA